MKHFSSIICFLLAIILIIAAYFRGRSDVLIMEMKTYQANLIELEEWQTNHPAELTEFMKGRYYYLANLVPRGWCSKVDFGPVNTNISYLSIGKGPTSSKEEYRKYKTLNGIR